MKLLIITQKVDRDDSVLGFFHEWIIEFSHHFEMVTVICLEQGSSELPSNVRVLSLGKEKKVSRVGYLTRFYSYIWTERKKYDVVFVHMNPIYIVFGGFLWRMLGKHINLWYVHRAVDLKLRIAGFFADTIYTAAKESCLLKTDKIRIVGHGIKTDQYATITRSTRLREDPVRIIHVGRVTPIKNCDTFIAAADILKKSWSKAVEIVFIGDPVTPADHEYKKMLEERIQGYNLADTVRFIGSVPNKELATQYAQADASVNLTPTGGIDKSVLESLASGVPVFFSNEAFLNIFAPYEGIFHIAYKDAAMLAEKIQTYFNRTDTTAIESDLRTRIITQFSAASLISRISLDIHHEQ